MLYYSIYLFFLTLSLLSNAGYCMIAKGDFTISNAGDFHYLTRFGCSIGECEYQVRFRLIPPFYSMSRTSGIGTFKKLIAESTPASIHLRLILDETWESIPIYHRPTCSHMKLSRVHKIVSLPLNGNWSDIVHGGVHQVMRPHIWYFLAEDCGGFIAEKIAEIVGIPKNKIAPLTIQWEFEMRQPNRSHFGYELFGTFPIIAFHIICYIIVLCILGVNEVKEMKKSGRLHIMIQMLNTAVLTQLSSSLLHLTHLFAYSFNGHGVSIINMFAEGLALISQIIMSTMLILIACGYTLSIQSKSTHIISTAVPVVIIVTTLHVVLVMFDSYNADPRFKSHAADGLLGLVLTILRLLLWAAFLFNFFQTSQNSSTSINKFLKNFAIAGSLYFLAYPIVFGITTICPPYVQHKVIINCIFIMQLISMIWLSSMFLTRGEYFKVSEFSQSYLPGGYLSSRGIHRID